MRLDFLLFASPVQDREEERNHCGAEPEPAYVGEVMLCHCLAKLVDGLESVVVQQET